MRFDSVKELKGEAFRWLTGFRFDPGLTPLHADPPDCFFADDNAV